MSKVKDDLELAHSCDIYLPTRTIFLTGEVDQSMYEAMIKNLHVLDTSSGTVTIYFNSEGGEVTHGLGIYNAIVGMKNHVRGIVWGSAESIASVILQGCDERIMLPHTYIMVHDGSDGHIEAPRHVQKKWQEFEDYQMKLIEDIYLEKIKTQYKRFSRKRLQDLLKTDTILLPDQAIKLGLVDFVQEVV